MKKLLYCLIALIMLQPVCHAQTGVYRALSAGIAHYDDGRERVGGVNSTQGVYDCLSRAFGSGGGFISAMRTDMDKAELFTAIALHFAEAGADDVSLIYINAHGGSQCGISWIETREGERVTAAELESCLRKIPGRVILLRDCCNSGGFIGNEGEFAGGFETAFGLNSFASSKYLVCVSSLQSENSYRVASGKSDEDSVSTVFSRALCEGLGWDLIGDRSTALKADADHDRMVTFSELVSYVRRRGMFYLSGSKTSAQTANAWFSDPGFALADRNPRY